MYWSSHLQQWLLPALQPYIPSQLQSYLPATQGLSSVANVDVDLTSEDLLKVCERHQYTSEIISLDPLVIYINNFTSTQEAEELINIGYCLFNPRHAQFLSLILFSSPEFADSFISRSRGGNQRVTGRTSQSAPLPMSDPLVDCILRRARTFMGSMLLPDEPFSVPQIVRYFPSQKYDLHTDFWPQHQVMTDGSNRLFNRVASFFVFLRDNCTEGYTYFPLVEPSHQSQHTDLEKVYGEKVMRGELDGEEKGIKFKPIQGNAVFWVNIDEQGQGDRRLVHAGLPVGDGEKIGMNLWPRKFYGTTGDEESEKKEKKPWSGKWKD